MTSAQVVETSVTVTDNSPFQDYPHPDDHTTQSKERKISGIFFQATLKGICSSILSFLLWYTLQSNLCDSGFLPGSVGGLQAPTNWILSMVTQAWSVVR